MQTDASDLRVGSVGLQQWKKGNNHEVQEQKKKFPFLQEKEKSQHHFQFKLSNGTRHETATFVSFTSLYLPMLVQTFSVNVVLAINSKSSKVLSWMKSLKPNNSEVFGCLIFALLFTSQNAKIETPKPASDFYK